MGHSSDKRVVSFVDRLVLICKTCLLTWARGILNTKRMSDESTGTPARFILFSEIYAGGPHGHGDGASDKFNGRLRDAAAGMARARLCGIGQRQTNRSVYVKTRLFVSRCPTITIFRERTFGLSESFGHVCGSIGGAFRPNSWKKCSAGAAVSMTLSG